MAHPLAASVILAEVGEDAGDVGFEEGAMGRGDDQPGFGRAEVQQVDGAKACVFDVQRGEGAGAVRDVAPGRVDAGHVVAGGEEAGAALEGMGR